MIPEVLEQLRAMLQVALDGSPEGRVDERQMWPADRIDHGCGTAHPTQAIRGIGSHAAKRTVVVRRVAWR